MCIKQGVRGGDLHMECIGKGSWEHLCRRREAWEAGVMESHDGALPLKFVGI